MTGTNEIMSLLEKMRQQYKPDKAQNLDTVIQFNITDGDENRYWLEVKGETLEIHEGQADEPQMTLIAAKNDFADMVYGRSKAMQAFMSGKLRVKGDMSLAMKLQAIFDL
jgi:putative sterol carrier protein